MIPIKSNERQIILDGSTYHVKLLGALAARDAFSRVSPMFVPLAGILADEMVNKEVNLETQIFTALATSIAHAISQPEVAEVADILLEKVYKDSQTINVDEEFTGNFKGYMKLVTFAFQENFLDFFLDLLASVGIQVNSMKDLKMMLEDLLKKPEPTSTKDAASTETD